MALARQLSGVATTLMRGVLVVGVAMTLASCSQKPTSPRAREPRSGFVTGAGGVRLHYLDFGGRGDPLVLLAGAGNTAWIYYELGQRLATTHHVLALTRRGFGDSDAPPAGYDRASLANDLSVFLDAQALTRVVLVGHSMAGEELTYFAGKYPKRVRALIYLDAISDRSQQDAALGDVPEFQILMPTPKDRVSVDSWVAFKRRQDRNLARFWTPAVERDARAGLTVGAEGVVRKDREAFSLFWDEMTSQPPGYSKISAPVLAIFAHEDERYQLPDDASPQLKAEVVAWQAGPQTAWREASIAQLLAVIPTAKIVDMEAAHHMFLQYPDKTLAIIREFLQTLP